MTIYVHTIGSWISLSAKELLEDEYSEIEYSDMDGEDDMIYDTPPYYHYEDEHQQYQHAHSQSHHPYQQQQIQQGRSLAFAGKGDYTSLPSSASSSHHSLQEQEQVEEALRASSRDYDSASSDSEATRQKAYRRGILSTGQPTRDHYYEIESTTLNSDDPVFSGSTTPLLSPPHFQAMPSHPDSVANKVLQGPSSLLAPRYVSWSVKAQSILDHASKETPHKACDGQTSTSSSRSSSPHSSPSTSGASTPSRVRRKRCPIPEPHQGFFSRALDQRSLASHVSVSRVGMAGTLCPPLQVGLRTGMLIRGSSPLRPTGVNPSPCSPSPPARQYSFKNVGGSSGVLTSRNENNCGVDDTSQQRSASPDDKENKRWYGQELGLNLWQTTLGAAALLGTGFGSGMVKKIQLHPSELSKENKENAV
ncbi:hypothetical protein BGZ80_011378 [Entomortierella chlamydospora]|uniref:Uncharacterized protein n=1 Tax=Entomortierella chlamydospora TaxID=101097 RepID=A0A9P6SZ30_9FUNG|nr:hypothetical protein BGZ80_011378 [Entomortierella chlamydospora]